MPESFDDDDEADAWVPLGEAVAKVIEDAEAAFRARLLGREAA
jgi:hypothetical protein